MAEAQEIKKSSNRIVPSSQSGQHTKKIILGGVVVNEQDFEDENLC